MFPDVIAETYEGKELRIELELVATSFREHQHDANTCDLIISFVKPFGRESIRGVPVISIFNGKGLKGGGHFDSSTLELTDYFQNLVTFSINQINNIVKKPQ
jgi:hypothetical protein